MNPKSSAEEVQYNSTREKSMAEGRAALLGQDINPDDYRSYFSLMEKADLPIRSCMPSEENLRKRKSLEVARDHWRVVSEGYDHINPEEHDEMTGKEIIAATKELVASFDTLFAEYIKEPVHAEEESGVLQELLALRKQIIERAREFAELPAYKAYREYGLWELDDRGRRGFQVPDEE